MLEPTSTQVALQFLAEVHESRDASTRMIDAAVINGLGLPAFGCAPRRRARRSCGPAARFPDHARTRRNDSRSLRKSSRLPQQFIQGSSAPSLDTSFRHRHSFSAQPARLLGELTAVLRECDARPRSHDTKPRQAQLRRRDFQRVPYESRALPGSPRKARNATAPWLRARAESVRTAL